VKGVRAPRPAARPPGHRSRHAAAIGVDLGGTKIEAIALAPTGEELWRQRVPTPPQHDYAATLAAILELVTAVERAIGQSRCTVGVAAPGTLTAAGLVKNANSNYLNGRPLATDLTRVLSRPVRIANDANCLAVSEATDGAGAGSGVVFAAILGTGVGGGIVVRGQPLDGPNGVAGEWGHIPLPWPTLEEASDAEPCYCGKRHCIENWLSGPALARDHARQESRLSAAVGGWHRTADTVEPSPEVIALTAREIARRAQRGDAACEATLRRHENRLARALAAVINVLDPDVIVLGGGLSNIERLYTNVPRLWNEFVFSGGARDAVRTRLVKARHGDSSGVRGAAWLWRHP
jgi:fructokinase